MIKKLVLHFPDGSVRTFDAATHQITITTRKVVVKNEQGEEEAFLAERGRHGIGPTSQGAGVVRSCRWSTNVFTLGET